MSLLKTKKRGCFQVLIVLYLSSQTFALYAEDVENVYQYKNSEGVTEFTDTVKENQQPVNEIKIPKMTEQEKAQATENLQKIEQQNEELDKRLDAAKQADKEQQLQRQKDQAQKKKDEEQSDESDDNIEYYNNGNIRNRPILPRPPLRPHPPVNRPSQPRPVQLPARGK